MNTQSLVRNTFRISENVNEAIVYVAIREWVLMKVNAAGSAFRIARSTATSTINGVCMEFLGVAVRDAATATKPTAAAAAAAAYFESGLK